MIRFMIRNRIRIRIRSLLLTLIPVASMTLSCLVLQVHSFSHWHQRQFQFQFQHKHQHQHQHRNCHCLNFENRNHRQHFNLSMMTTKLKSKSNADVNVNVSDSDVYGANEHRLSYPNLSIIGICGSIGSGKSFTSSLLVSKLNSILSSDSNSDDSDRDNHQIAFHIDTDSLAHGVYVPGSLALQQIEQTFGKEVIQNDGTVNRKVLGSIVFKDQEEMTKLERIVWPHVKTLLLQKLDQINHIHDINNNCKELQSARSRPKVFVVVVEAAVLLDANWDDNDLFDAIWVVRSSSQITTQRLVENRRMDKDDAVKRMEAQMSRRGIGNVQDEIDNGTITAIIENDKDSSDNLWEMLKQTFMDPKSWKDGRCPTCKQPNLNLFLKFKE